MTIKDMKLDKLVILIDSMKYHPKELTAHPTRQCCDIYDGIASHIYGNHCHVPIGSGDRRAIEHVYKQSKWS